ncbi:MAG: NgoFVII family restriction endonuclease [Lachnospiraceae bacterium]|nr:NgoFVII family restriction endonuclease [Lachnospiraceae bacterium]
MPTDLHYSDSIAQQLLFDPIKEGANKLCILTSHATPSMASWLLKSYEEKGITDVEVELIISDVIDEGIDDISHEGFKELHGNRYSSIWSNFSCSYLFQPPALKQNYYIWLDDEKPVKAFGCSYEFTQQSMLRTHSGSMHTRLAVYAHGLYEKAVDRSIYCNHSEVDDYIVVRSSSTALSTSSHASEENCVHLSLLARGGETGTKSGLNWGQRSHRNKNEAYIPLPVKIARSDFFPLNKQHFLVVTDDHHTLQLRVEQQNDKAITTPASNALLGEYFRNRLGLPNGSYIKKEHLLAYGRSDVTFHKIDEEQYYMDFSVNNQR